MFYGGDDKGQRVRCEQSLYNLKKSAVVDHTGPIWRLAPKAA